MMLLVMGDLEGRKEMFYLPTHSAPFYGCVAFGRMVTDHSDSKKRNLLPTLHGLHFPIGGRGGGGGGCGGGRIISMPISTEGSGMSTSLGCGAEFL